MSTLVADTETSSPAVITPLDAVLRVLTAIAIMITGFLIVCAVIGLVLLQVIVAVAVIFTSRNKL